MFRSLSAAITPRLPSLALAAAPAPAALTAAPARTYMRGLVKSPTRKALDLHQRHAETHPHLLRTDALLAQATNLIMRDGKKAQAHRMLTDSLDHVRAMAAKPGSTLPQGMDPPAMFAEAVARAAPLLETKAFKRGTKVLQIPKALDERQRNRRAIVWMLEAAKKRHEKEFAKRLANEIVAVLEGTSEAIKRKDALYKLALANRVNVNIKMNI
ncbi:ribosomal protein S7 domain-containing protein [Catenaria anguillulae PL171]|uniref:Ribosomal protein S7 domain-containing protein n=1 Tax=Catenaria anguillulae PL171 TaxID=765915 RepID=A0A1Y2HDD5_9FUNG|nr:ribosomal protein S7 domain-containing protein [Catenaria anguillulae PL171]